MAKITEKDINRLVRIIKENNELDDWGWFDQFSFTKEKPKEEKKDAKVD